MFRFQIRRLHRTGLALAAATLFATSLMSTAFAAPADSLPASADSEAVALNPIVLPIAQTDLEIIPWASEFAPNGGIRYRFRMYNYGPETGRAKVEVHMRYQTVNGQTPAPVVVNLDSGSMVAYGPYVWLNADCPQPNAAHVCRDATAHLIPLQFDTEPGNNVAYNDGHFS